MLLLIFLMLARSGVVAQSSSKTEWQQQRLFTSLDEALKTPTEVYRLKLKIKADSLPEEVFQLTNLQQLIVSRSRLCMLNHRIGELTHLQYLDVSANQLVRLPDELCNLVELKELIINRNHIEALPENIGNLLSLTYIDAWDNPLYELPPSIADLRYTLLELDLRQVELRDEELEAMERLLPATRIQYTSTCDCHSNRK